MERRDVLMALAAFSACARAFAKTPQGAGLVVVSVGERRSDIRLVRGNIVLARECVAMGAADFVSDAGCAGFVRDTLKRAGAGETPVLLAGNGGMTGLAEGGVWVV